jgi:hypothetical protein
MGSNNGGSMNYGYETKLWVWLFLETIIPWSFNSNSQSNYVKS